jgi:integration host factor subunit alpha
MADGTPTNFNSDIVGKTLTKADFVESVYSKIGGLSRRDSADIVDMLFEAVKETLSRGEPVKISGFGNFVVREKKARVGRNPQTGRDIEISARRVLTFKPSQVLKDQLNG